MIYFYIGDNLSAIIPLLYTLSSIFSLYYFSKSKKIYFIQKSQLSMILLFPFLLMWSLGGFTQSSYIFIWSFFAPIAALIHDKDKKSYWLYSFIALIVLSAIIDSWLSQNMPSQISVMGIEIFFVLNISVALSGIYFLIRYFIQKNDKNANEKLQAKHHALLNNTKKLYDNISFLESYKNNIDNNLIVTRTDINGKITFANENFYTISQYTKKEVIGKSHNIVRHEETSKKVFKELWDTILQKKAWHGTLKNKRKDGSSYWIDTTISPILNKDNEIVEFIAIRHNISKLIEHQDELKDMLYTDSLTGLKNRNALLEDLKTDNKLSCILLNIDNFSHTNNLYGEDFGNKVLIEFGAFLSEYIKDFKDLKLYRLSGDEFIILSSKTEIQKIATELLKKNKELLISVDEQHLSLNITIAISLEKNDLLISTASMAITVARKESKNIIIYKDSLSLNSEYENNIKWIKEIKNAIEEDRIAMFYQPIIDHINPSKRKYEALIRLIDKDGHVITPFHFLEIAKKAKLYKKLTKIVLKKSFEAFKDNDYDFSLNITIEDILDEDINNYIIKTLQKYNISKRVVFEIVESESIENFDKIEKFITMIKSYGCRISIDDFGTGYSNFEYLMRLQPDFIKIDGSIIKEINTDKRSEIITSVIVAFAKEMNIKTIGEYVETKEINDKLIKLGVDKSQGYYFDKPQAYLKEQDKNPKK